MSATVDELPLSELFPPKKDYRVRHTPGHRRQKDNLAASITKDGLLKPILYFLDADVKRVADGWTRVEVYRALGRSTIPCIRLDGKVTESRLIDIQLASNNLHKGFDPTAVAQMALDEIRGHNISPAEFCRRHRSISPSVLSKLLAVYDRLDPALADKVRAGEHVLRTAYALAKLPRETQVAAFAQTEHMSVVDREEFLRGGVRRDKKPKPVKLTVGGLVLTIRTSDPAELREWMARVTATLAKIEKLGLPLANLPGLLKD